MSLNFLGFGRLWGKWRVTNLFDTPGTLSGHFLDTPEPEARKGPQRHPEGHSRDTSGPREGPRDSCSKRGGLQNETTFPIEIGSRELSSQLPFSVHKGLAISALSKGLSVRKRFRSEFRSKRS